MKKYFFISDIHSFYTAMIESLHKAGYDENNQDHILVVLGDIFDRGTETLEVYNFLKNLPKERRILIRGNHEWLYKALLVSEFPGDHDFHNGTVRTMCTIAGEDENKLNRKYWYRKEHEEGKQFGGYASTMPRRIWLDVRSKVLASEITDFLISDDWINYLETEHYIFVHSWIPTAIRPYMLDGEIYEGYYVEYGYREDWRNATQQEWDDATWGCPWSKAKKGWNKTGKTIVCGHWHTSDFFNNLTKQRKDEDDCPLFKSKRYKLIGLDACTVVTDKVNVLVLNEDEL